MAKINKIYPSFYNGVTEQSAELALDNQCKAMVNCVPSIIHGLHKRPPAAFVTSNNILPSESKIVHSYNRGENNEEYIFVATGSATDPLQIFNKAGEQMSILYEDDVKTYLSSINLKGLTVQDRTWLVNKDEEVVVDTTDREAPNPYYDRTGYYWLSRGSGDRYNPYNYAVYINGTTIAINPDKPNGSTSDPETGCEDSDYAAGVLTELINAEAGVGIPDYIRAYNVGSIIQIYLAYIHTPLFRLGSASYNHVWVRNNTTLTESLVSVFDYKTSFDLIHGNTSLYCTYNSTEDYYNLVTIADNIGSDYSITVPYYPDTATVTSDLSPAPESVTMTIEVEDVTSLDFTLDSWDSWGNQASISWKGSVNKLTDLPKEFIWDDTYVEIVGEKNDNFTNYYVKWNGEAWEETVHPSEVRGVLTNMPIAVDRTSLVNGVATFTISELEWSEPIVGNLENNPDPTFVGQKITDLFFYKNRFGIAASDSIVLTESANYTNFYIQTALDVLDNDPVDIAIATNQASKIYYVQPFNTSLYIFTQASQFELIYDGVFSPKTVSVENTTNYPMSTNVTPKVVNNSLYFISTTNNQHQLREYIKNEKLAVEGLDLNLTTPTFIKEEIQELIVNGVLGIVLCCTKNNVIYVYNYKEDGQQRVQSAWSKWVLFEGLDYIEDSFEYAILGASLVVVCKTADNYLYHLLELDKVFEDNKVDIGYNNVEYPYTSSIQLPDYYPHLSEVGTPKDKVLLKKITIQGEGSFNASLYRKDYNKTYTKQKDLGFKDLDFHVSSKVGNVDLSISDNTTNDFKITSIIMEGLFSPTSKEMR